VINNLYKKGTNWKSKPDHKINKWKRFYLPRSTQSVHGKSRCPGCSQWKTAQNYLCKFSKTIFARKNGL